MNVSTSDDHPRTVLHLGSGFDYTASASVVQIVGLRVDRHERVRYTTVLIRGSPITREVLEGSFPWLHSSRGCRGTCRVCPIG